MSGPKITFIGAGSTVFAKNLIGDLLSYPELTAATLTLFDIDQERLGTSEIVAHKIADVLDVKPFIEATTDRRAALAGADYVVSMFQVGGYRPSTVIDFDIPKKYGLRQTIGDTLGIGGIMRGLRTIPVFQSMLADMEELCPHAVHLNYVNPMVMNCWAMNASSSIRTVGLCHSVQHTAADLAKDIGVPIEEIDYLCAGINHMAFYLKFERDGKSLYPLIEEVARSGKIPSRGDIERPDGGVGGLSDAVRYKMYEKLGYFVTESSEHFSEYVPWFVKNGREDLIEEFGIPLDEYLRRCEHQLDGWHSLRKKLEDPNTRFKVRPSDEYGATIIHSMHTDQPSIIYGNVTNGGDTDTLSSGAATDRALIENLPHDCVVEVPCDVTSKGIAPRQIGKLPLQLAALMQTNINVQALTVEAALTGNREHVYHAAMFDPLTAAVLSVDEICALVDELIEAHGEYLPEAIR